MKDLWPNFSLINEEENKAVEILREQARLLEKKTNKQVKATFSKLNYSLSPSVAIIAELATAMQKQPTYKETIEPELDGKKDANELYKLEEYKLEIYNDKYRFRVLILKNRVIFPVYLKIDDDIKEELYPGEEKDIEIRNNSDLEECLSGIFSSNKLKTIVSRMMKDAT